VAAKFAILHCRVAPLRQSAISPAGCGVRGKCMLKAFKKAESSRGPFRRLSDSEILLFVSRTLQSRGSEPNAPDVFSKLQNLKDIIDQQEIDLLDWPDSPGKDRFYASLLKAKSLVTQVADYLEDATKDSSGGDAKTP
jgi:hypothetical protein